jgi:predicted metal-dependent hydrolase
VWAHAETRKVLGLMGARVVEAELSLGKAPDRLAEPDEDLLGRIRATIALLVDESVVRAAAA